MLSTSVGVSAGIGLGLTLVEADFSRDRAQVVASDLVAYLTKPGGQSQFIVHLPSQQTEHQRPAGLVDVNLDNRLSLA
ncbi:Transcriptional regulator, AraC family [Caballeronia sordidicola]|uniref:Transcriptional regulator, AraC family n=2 Tax=Caballeronia sordidicola TaxID=196367 RepID=A0A226X218_CABSO|nr:Transcriptional regulator, AraC family [Caballeronia sordidicola]